MKYVYILGATGSIGSQALEVIQSNEKDFILIGVSLGRNDYQNFEILDNNKNIEIACLRSDEKLDLYKQKYSNVKFVVGNSGLLEVSRYSKKGMLLNALSGGIGLIPTYEAIMSGKDIALANKETLVMGGDIIMKAAKKMGVKIYPVDSEHNAIWLLLKDEKQKDIKKIVLTASGGAFRDLTRDELINVTVEDALKHPNWKMGPKITIDSATMANKCFEIIEAHHLFDMPYDKIDSVLHKESIIHGMVYLIDNTIKAELGNSDMRIPISIAFYYPERKPNISKEIDLTELNFKKMDYKRYPLVNLIYEIGKKGRFYPVVFNTANDVAVELFLARKISFLDIEKIIIKQIKEFSYDGEYNLDSIIRVSEEVRNKIIKNESR